MSTSMIVAMGCGGTALSGGEGGSAGASGGGSGGAGTTGSGGGTGGSASTGGTGGGASGAGGAGSAGTGGASSDAGASCTLGGKVYPSGASQLPSPDGCNTCSCQDGQLECTEIGCLPKSCLINGAPYASGTKNIPSGDGCNICSCTNGEVACTAAACAVVPCGARAGDTCKASEYCAYTAGQLCGAADAQATCKPRPTGCSMIFDQVCGCDGKTYGNACLAAVAGIGTHHAGACESTARGCLVNGMMYASGAGNIPAGDGCNTCACTDGNVSCTLKGCPASKACGGFAGSTCGPNEYCAYVEGQLCGAADASATCKVRPNACTAVEARVCGCDGKAYANSCTAAAGGTGVRNAGACVQ